jgi:rSAM/selenodomain-associated transferase 2
LSDSTPDISIVIPVLYEADTIGDTLEHVRKIESGDRFQVIVVDGDPGGGTIETITRNDVMTLVSRPWRSRQMNAGAAAASGGILLFLHADTLLPDTVFSDIVHVVRGGSVGGAFRLRFDSNRLVYRIMSGFVTIRSRLNRLPYGDQAIFLRRDYFQEIGGYDEIPLMEDVEIVRRIRRLGGRLTILDTAVRTSCRRMESEGIAKRVVQNWLISILYNFGASPEKLVKYYTEDYRR